ncbi:glucosamine-6-phosphate deaminase [Horticoccus sp. 23ND18S-11]|uniref:glucosamine-6-phosphate deaminase n=1 Tax=Horticoccus sp. 23ND18S-11 TaxID=3391832 RepID=UPI0039C9E213
MTASPSRYFTSGRLGVEVHADRPALGLAAAQAAAAYLHDVIASRGQARVIFACAPSQNEFLASLLAVSKTGHMAVDWSQVTAFHMDDYVGLTGQHPQSFRHYLQTHFLSHVKIGRFHPVPAEEPDSAAVCARYTALLSEKPIDLICLGIGENGHIAFNDPPVADFEDPQLIKVVELDDACRHQQVNDGCFPTFADVPRHAFTLTVSIFRRARRLSIHVPGPRKADAVKATLEGPVSTACPASILRLHPEATLYIDRAAAGRLTG